MSQFDVVWYGRAAAWIGAFLLVLMALTGHQVAVVTVAAVIGLIIGIGLLLYSIPGGKLDDPPRWKRPAGPGPSSSSHPPEPHQEGEDWH